MNIVREFELQFWSEFENNERVRLLSNDCTFHRWNLLKIDEYLKSGKGLDEAMKLTASDISENFTNQHSGTISSFNMAFLNIANRMISSLATKDDVSKLVQNKDFLPSVVRPYSLITESIQVIRQFIGMAEISIFMRTHG